MPKAKAAAESEFEVGQLVSFEYEGETKEGTITKINAKKEEADVEGDDLPDGLVCEFHEMTVVTKGKAKAKTKADPEPDPDDDPKPKKKGGTNSLKAAFNSKPPAEGGAMGFPVGTHECLVVDGLCATNDKGTSAYLELCAVNGDIDGRSQRKFYQLFDPEGTALDGIGYLKADMILMGIWDEDFEVDAEDLEGIVDELNSDLKKLKKKQPWVSVNVVEGKKGYNNVYIQSLMEDQDSKPQKPE